MCHRGNGIAWALKERRLTESSSILFTRNFLFLLSIDKRSPASTPSLLQTAFKAAKTEDYAHKFHKT